MNHGIVITDEMVKTAQAVAPVLTDGVVRKMLEAAMFGQIVFRDAEGCEILEGKPEWPSLLQIQIRDPHRALEYAQTLIAGARRMLYDKEPNYPVTLVMGGSAYCSD